MAVPSPNARRCRTAGALMRTAAAAAAVLVALAALAPSADAHGTVVRAATSTATTGDSDTPSAAGTPTRLGALPYVEDVSHRMQWSNVAPADRVEGWTLLPAALNASVAQVAAAPVAPFASLSAPPVAATLAGTEAPAFWVLGSSALYHATLPCPPFTNGTLPPCDAGPGFSFTRLDTAALLGDAVVKALANGGGARCRVAASMPSGRLAALVCPDTAFALQCAFASQCAVVGSAAGSFGAVNDTTVVEWPAAAVSASASLHAAAAAPMTSVWVASANGLFVVDIAANGGYDTAERAAAVSVGVQQVLSDPCAAVAAATPTPTSTAASTRMPDAPTSVEVAAGSAVKIYLLTATAPSRGPTHADTTLTRKHGGDFAAPGSSAAVRRWEWVTDVAQGAGGVVDAPITSLAYDACGSLWVGNAVCVNVMHPDGAFVRIGPLQGLPSGDVLSIARDWGSMPTPAAHRMRARDAAATALTPVGDMWVGTTLGLARFSAVPDDASAQYTVPGACVAHLPQGRPRRGDFRWFAGRRWLPVRAQGAAPGTATPAVVGSVASGGNATLVATAGGLALISHQSWTLDAKAAHYQAMVPRHDRYGFTADCGLPSAGNLSALPAGCTPGESDGLWTGIMSAGETLRAAVEGTSHPDALTRAARRLDAMEFLTTVTGIPGYPARGCAKASDGGWGGKWWHNSSAAPGWVWMGNTSADEICGHMVAFPSALAALGNATGQRDLVTHRILDMIGTIVSEGFILRGWHQLPTRWGIWAPSYVNGLRDWSDQRGLNALQMLAFLHSAVEAEAAAAADAKPTAGDGGDGSRSLRSARAGTSAGDPFASALAELNNSTNQYGANMLNQKIEAPIDDNFSDDELAHLPLLEFVLADPTNAALQAALHRTYGAVQGERSALWSAVYLAGTAKAEDVPHLRVRGLHTEVPPVPPAGWRAKALSDLLWSLRAWPLEQIDWSTLNSVRVGWDLRVNPEPDRDGKMGTQSARVLPPNERSQFRWNSNPYYLDGGSAGGREFDPGAWLMPFWVARYYGAL